MLTDVERELLTVTVLATLQTLPQLAAHVRTALHVGTSPLEVRETLYQCSPYIGYPRTLNAVATADEVFVSEGIELPLPDAATVSYEERDAAGAAVQVPLYGEEVKEVFAALPEPFARFVPHLLMAGVFGDIATRGGLDAAMGELVSLVAIAALGAATQLRPHVAGAIRAGNSRQKVAAALVQAIPYIGGPQALSGLALVASYDADASSEAYR